MENTVQQRISDICLSENISITELAKKIDMPQTTVNNYMNGSRKVSLEFINAMVNSFELNANWLLTGKGDIYISDSTEALLTEKQKGSIPYYANLPVSAGQAGLTQSTQEEKPTGYMNIPNVSAESIFPVVGCSMLPRIKSGDIIGVNRVNSYERVDPDKIYMIITHEERMIKRLRIDNEDDSILWCISENYNEFKIYKHEIITIFHVVYHGELL